eukprot:6564750-Prymnesium_polylepis.1
MTQHQSIVTYTYSASQSGLTRVLDVVRLIAAWQPASQNLVRDAMGGEAVAVKIVVKGAVVDGCATVLVIMRDATLHMTVAARVYQSYAELM